MVQSHIFGHLRTLKYLEKSFFAIPLFLTNDIWHKPSWLLKQQLSRAEVNHLTPQDKLLMMKHAERKKNLRYKAIKTIPLSFLHNFAIMTNIT